MPVDTAEGRIGGRVARGYDTTVFRGVGTHPVSQGQRRNRSLALVIPRDVLALY